MVNYNTSQYENLELIFYLSCFGVFQYVRDILQFTVSLDHPLAELMVSDMENQMYVAQYGTYRGVSVQHY